MAAESWRYAGGVTETAEADPVTLEREEAPQPAPRRPYEQLLSESYRFDFFQAVSLMERLFPDAPAPGETSSARAERIHLRPSTSLVFPPADVEQVEIQERPVPRGVVTATFMGLYGVDSPLPEIVRERVALEQDETEPLRTFLDIFNHRLYSYFYRAWKKYRYERARPGSSGRERSLRHLALAGLGTPRALEGAPIDPERLAGLAGRLTSRVRNAEGLRHMLASLLKMPVSVAENVPQWVQIRERPALGARNGLRLGSTATVGARVYDEAGKFRVSIGPLAAADFLSLLPGAAGARQVAWLIGLYVPDQLTYDVELKLRADEALPTRLGVRESRLGLTTFIGKPQTDVVSRIVTYA